MATTHFFGHDISHHELSVGKTTGSSPFARNPSADIGGAPTHSILQGA